MIMDSSEWTVNNDEWESKKKKNCHRPNTFGAHCRLRKKTSLNQMTIHFQLCLPFHLHVNINSDKCHNGVLADFCIPPSPPSISIPSSLWVDSSIEIYDMKLPDLSLWVLIYLSLWPGAKQTRGLIQTKVTTVFSWSKPWLLYSLMAKPTQSSGKWNNKQMHKLG